MRVLISIEHPAWAYQFRYIIEELQQRGDEVLVLAVKKDGDTELLRDFGIPYKLMEKSTGRNVLEKTWLFLKLCVTYTREARKFRPDILIGRASPMMAVAAFLTGKPHVIYEDMEASRFSLNICKLFSSEIITTNGFLRDLGRVQKRFPIFKEWFYLDPTHFSPDKQILRLYGIDPDVRYVVIRFVAWKASHDFGLKVLSDADKKAFCERLSRYARVCISSELELPPDLEQYRISLPYDKIHHLLYYAQLLITDGATMASEAVMLGTHAITLYPIKCGTIIDQEERYHLLNWLPGATPEWFEKGLAIAIKLLNNRNLWEEGKHKREKLIDTLADANAVFMQEMDNVLLTAKHSDI